ncbi:MAG: ribonuclease E activity regulator RraA [Gammaproteobacteria bacterium]|nr:ribonuclease E activity regulator RraA [Gammaproteobacteria bacterium]
MNKPMTYKTADLYDEYGDSLQVAEPLFNNYGGNGSFHGRAYTLKVFEDFLLIKHTVQQPGEQQVLVIDGGASLRCALLGDKLAAIAVENNWSGVIINGCIRDAAEVSKLAVGVKALNTCPARPTQLGEGQKEIDVRFAGVTFSTGAYVYADLDGVVVSETPC